MASPFVRLPVPLFKSYRELEIQSPHVRSLLVARRLDRELSCSYFLSDFPSLKLFLDLILVC